MKPDAEAFHALYRRAASMRFEAKAFVKSIVEYLRNLQQRHISIQQQVQQVQHVQYVQQVHYVQHGSYARRPPQQFGDDQSVGQFIKQLLRDSVQRRLDIVQQVKPVDWDLFSPLQTNS